MLLEAPNPKDPQDAEVAKMMMDDHEYFESVAHDWAVKYAGAPRSRPSADQVQRKTKEKKEDDINKYVALRLATTIAAIAATTLALVLQLNSLEFIANHSSRTLGIKAGTRIWSTNSSTWASSWTLS